MSNRTRLTLILALSIGSTAPAAAQVVALTLDPASVVQTTIQVTSAFGNDSDGPKPVAISGIADAQIMTRLDTTQGLVADSFAFTNSALEFADTDFQVTIFTPIDISLVGIRGVFSTDTLAPGSALAQNTAEFDVAPLSLEWTEGEIVVLDPPGIPAAGTVFPLVGMAVVTTTPNGNAIDVTATIPVSSVDSVTEAGFTVTTTLSGSVVLIGSFVPAAVPGLKGWGQVAGAALLLTVVLVVLERRNASA